MSRMIRILLAVFILTQPLAVFAPRARAASLKQQDPTASAIAQGLKDFASRLDDMGSFDALWKEIPLTSVSPNAEDALRLGTLFGESLGELEDEYASVNLLVEAIYGFDGVYGEVELAFTDVVTKSNSSLTDLSFTVVASRTTSLPLFLSEDPVELSGGGITVTLGLSTTLDFQLDSSESDVELKFYLPGEPTINVSIDAEGKITPFGDRFGFVGIDVTGTVFLDEDISIDFADPDSDGRITRYEWTYTHLIDLFSVTHAPCSGAGCVVSATLGLEAKPVGLVSDGTIKVQDKDLSDGFEPIITLGELENFSNVNADDVLIGVAQLAAALRGAQMVGDVQLPFLSKSLGDAYSLADPLIQFVTPLKKGGATSQFHVNVIQWRKLP